MPISSCDDYRLKLDQQVTDAVAEGRELIARGDIVGALDRFIFAFEHSPKQSIRVGMAHLIVSLGRTHPPASDVVRKRRDEAQHFILDGAADSEVVLEWLALTRAIGDSERLLDVLGELEKRRILNDYVRESIVYASYEFYLCKKNYEALAIHFDSFGAKFLQSMVLFEVELLNLGRSSSSTYQISERVFIKDGTMLFELALGLRKDFQADEIAKRVFEHCSDFDTAKMLLDAAVRAERQDRISFLLKLARVQLSDSDYERLKQVAS